MDFKKVLNLRQPCAPCYGSGMQVLDSGTPGSVYHIYNNELSCEVCHGYGTVPVEKDLGQEITKGRRGTMRVALVFWRGEHMDCWELEMIFHSRVKAQEYIEKMIELGDQRHHYNLRNWPVS